jgi:hypothetical protein
MSERKRVAVDEEALMKMMAGNIRLHKVQEDVIFPVAEGNKEEAEGESGKENFAGADTVRSPDVANKEQNQKKRKGQKADFPELYLKDKRIRERRQVYISMEVFQKISKYLKYIGEVSMTVYIDNVLLHHLEENKDIINDMFGKNYSNPL